MAAGLIALIIIGAIALLIIIWIMSFFNRTVSLTNQVQNAFAQIDVQLKRRTDLIPNLVETVKGYAKHEREVLENVTKARTQYLSATSVADKVKTSNQLTDALSHLFAVAENYPQLKANKNFLALQEELSTTENKIAHARQYYNDRIMEYNTYIQVMPNNMLAGMFNRHSMEPLKATERERENVKVKF